jgi:putative transposase
MARRLRIHLPGGFYHVTLRGNHRLPIFFKESDRELLDSIVADVITSQHARVHAFCWMTNHLHLVIQISDMPLGTIMMRIASRYARILQADMATTGHLFERRYHCKLIDADNYLLAVIRYIHLNPVVGGLVTDPADYRWSSHREYLGQSTRQWVTTSFGLRLLARHENTARRMYRNFVDSAQSSDEDELRLGLGQEDNLVLGDDEFTKRIAKIPLVTVSRKSLAEIVGECSELFAIRPETLASNERTRRLTMARAWVGHQALSLRVASICDVARLFNRDESSLREAMKRYPPSIFESGLLTPGNPENPESPTRHQ